MEFISKEKTRKTTYFKRKKGLLKKAQEISILCNAPVCIIIYPYKEGNTSLDAEVYSFKGDDTKLTSNLSIDCNPSDLARARDPEIARVIIDRYLKIPNEEKNKRATNLCDMFVDLKRKANQELSKLRHKNGVEKYPFCDSYFDGLSLDQIMELIGHLDQKIECVRQRIAMIKMDNHNHDQNLSLGLVPFFCEATPISTSVINPIDQNFGHPFMEYPNEQEDFQQFHNFNDTNNYLPSVYYNSNVNYFPDHRGRVTSVDDHGSGCSSGGGTTGNNYEMSRGVGARIYDDQRLGFADHIGATSSYGGGAGFIMPPWHH